MIATHFRQLRKVFLMMGAALALLPAGCSRVVSYHPVNTIGVRVSQWTATVEGVRVTAGQQSDLEAATNFQVCLNLANQSSEVVEVVGVALESAGKRFRARLSRAPADVAARTVLAGQTEDVGVHVALGDSAHEMLGPTMTMNWRLRIGNNDHVVQIRMSR